MKIKVEWIVIVVVWTLALYGLFEIVKSVINICTCTRLRTEGIYFIVATKNQENHIEGFLRNLMFKIIYGKEDIIKNIIVVDLNSTDSTGKILEKMEQEYEQITVLNLKECKELLENIKEV